MRGSVQRDFECVRYADGAHDTFAESHLPGDRSWRSWRGYAVFFACIERENALVAMAGTGNCHGCDLAVVFVIFV